MSTENWFSDCCHDCNQKNWIYCGDSEDLTSPDIDFYQCWFCYGLNLLPEDGFRTLTPAEGWLYCAKGRQNQNEHRTGSTSRDLGTA